jgi:hypothetical protein
MSDAAPQCVIPKDWAKFFAALLLSPELYEKAKDFMLV